MNSAAAAAAVPLDGPRHAVVTASVMMAALLQTLDNTIASVALPRMQGSVSASQDQMAWVLTSYIIAAAILTPLSGWLAGRIGRRRLLLASIAGFTVASVFCGAAQTLPEIVVARVMQGMCGAALMPMSQSVLLDINPSRIHGRTLATWLMAATLGPLIGPAIGGWITEHYSWRWVFYINVPGGIIAYLGLVSALPETQLRKSRFDFFGFAALSVGIGALQLVLDRGQLRDWFSSAEICIEAIVAGLAFYLFVVHMLTTTRERFVSLALFRDRNFLAGNAFLFVTSTLMFSSMALLPPLLQQLMNYPVVTAGMVTVPRGVGNMMGLIIAGRLVERTDGRYVIVMGCLLTAWSMWVMTGFDLQMDQGLVMWSGFSQGVGIAFAFAPAAASAFATLAPALRNDGTAIFSLTRNLSASTGISVMVMLVTRNSQILHAALAEHVSRYSGFMRAHLPPGVPNVRSLQALDAAVTRQAAMIAYIDDFKLMALLCLAAIPLVLLLRGGRPAAAPPVPVD
jgi:MFS transporter, DHA2 family, multidrug resistance protein